MLGYSPTGGDSPTAKNSLAATGDSKNLSQLLASLQSEHEHRIDAARLGNGDDENSKVFRDLVEQLVNEHELQVALARSQAVKEAQEKIQVEQWGKRGVSGDNPIGHSGRLQKPTRPRRTARSTERFRGAQTASGKSAMRSTRT